MAQPPIPIWVFGVRLLYEFINVPVYNLTVTIKKQMKNVLEEGLKLKDRVAVKKVAFDGDNWELVAEVSSDNAMYVVTLYMPLDYECTCPYSQHYFEPCKHVLATVVKVLEDSGIDIRDRVVWRYVSEGFNRLAHYKARTHRMLV